MRRFRLTTPDGDVEAIQFSRGPVVADAHPAFGGMLHAWIDLEHLRTERPDWPITWIDPEDTP